MKRALIARALSCTGAVDRILEARRNLRTPYLTVLTYHRVCERTQSTGLDPGTLDADPSGFRLQLDFIQKHFEVVSARCLEGWPNLRLPANPLILTFDDGYRDNYTTVWPILKERGLSATFFIATAYPDAGRLYWWDRVALLLGRCEIEPVQIGPIGLSLRPITDPAGARSAILKALKCTKGLDPDTLCRWLERAAKVHLSAEEEREIARSSTMGWAEIEELASAGMQIESHSHEHRVLETMEEDQMERDLRQSKELLTRHVRKEPFAMAYPTGRTPGDKLKGVVRRLGFSCAFTNKTGIGRGGSLDRFEVPRLAMDRELDQQMFQAILAVPYLSEVHAYPALAPALG